MFSLFLDVMGVQAALLAQGSSDEIAKAKRECADTLEAFHNDIKFVVGMQAEMRQLSSGAKLPSFVAEFSDSVYIVSDDFDCIWFIAVTLMRKAMRHGYPLRGGLGYGDFSHETSGVQTKAAGQVWTTASFHGSAVVTAYIAERSPALGQRIFVHSSAREAIPSGLLARILSLEGEEESPAACSEVRCWTAEEVQYARDWHCKMRDSQNLSERAKAHYEATLRSMDRLEQVQDSLFIDDGMWLPNLRILQPKPAEAG